jgi:hypothetical protein
MKKFEDILSFKSGIFPDCLAIDSVTPSSADGTEFIQAMINNGTFGPLQALIDYANIVPDGVIEAAGTAQILDAINKGYGVGPGKYVQWGLDDDPSVTGDRVLLLSGQGVLIASYPDLDAATWIGGDTAAQVAAIAAGKKFYRSSDAAGTTGDAAGPYLQLPENNPTVKKQYLGDGTDFTVTSSPAVTVLNRAVAIPYQTNDGTWRLRFNIVYQVSTASRTSLTMTISGVVFKNSTASPQYVSCSNQASPVTSSETVINTGNVFVFHNTANTAKYLFYGDVELESKPTWADDFSIPWGITY